MGKGVTTTHLIITGRIPSKKNSKEIHWYGGKPKITPSDSHQAWHTEQCYRLKMYAPEKPIEKARSVTLEFHFADNRQKDLTNAAESVMDLLVDLGFLADDKWQVTGPVHLIPRGIDRENPGCLVTIEQWL